MVVGCVCGGGGGGRGHLPPLEFNIYNNIHTYSYIKKLFPLLGHISFNFMFLGSAYQFILDFQKKLIKNHKHMTISSVYKDIQVLHDFWHTVITVTLSYFFFFRLYDCMIYPEMIM